MVARMPGGKSAAFCSEARQGQTACRAIRGSRSHTDYSDLLTRKHHPRDSRPDCSHRSLPRGTTLVNIRYHVPDLNRNKHTYICLCSPVSNTGTGIVSNIGHNESACSVSAELTIVLAPLLRNPVKNVPGLAMPCYARAYGDWTHT